MSMFFLQPFVQEFFLFHFYYSHFEPFKYKTYLMILLWFESYEKLTLACDINKRNSSKNLLFFSETFEMKHQ